MSPLPILQMAIVPDRSNANLTLKFSVELDEYVEPVFVIPFPPGNEQLPTYINTQFILPGEFDGEYTEYKLTLKNDYLELNDQRFGGLTPLFWIGEPNLFWQLVTGYSDEFNHPLKYSGKHKEIISQSHRRFLLLYPVDLYVMDELYRRHKACFVGYTPIFGNRERLAQMEF